MAITPVPTQARHRYDRHRYSSRPQDYGDCVLDHLTLLVDTPEATSLTLEHVAKVDTGAYALGERLAIYYDPRAPRRCLPTAQLYHPGVNWEFALEALNVPLVFGLFLAIVVLADQLSQQAQFPKSAIEGIGLLVLGLPCLLWFLTKSAWRWRTSRYWYH